MINIIKLKIIVYLFLILGFSVVEGNENAGVRTEAYKKRAAQCDRGEKVESYWAHYVIKEEDGIEKLRAVLENDCMRGVKNSIGRTLVDSLANLSQESSSYRASSCRMNSWGCYLISELFNWLESPEGKGDSEELAKELGKVNQLSFNELLDSEKSIKDMKKRVKLLVRSEWLSKPICEKIGLTELDIALIKDDAEGVIAILDNLPHMEVVNPAQNAELFRFLSYASSRLQHLVVSHKNYSRDLMSANIKDPMAETIVLISGSGEGAWNYREISSTIDRVEKLGLNWILLGDGVSDIELKDVEDLKCMLDELKGRRTFLILAHGRVEEGKHNISLDRNGNYLVETRRFFEILKKINDDKAVDVIINSCYSGAAYIDAVEVLPDGSRFFSSASINQPGRAYTKLMINGIDHFMAFRNKYESAFELFNIAYLYKRLDLYMGQMIARITKPEPIFLEVSLDTMDVDYVCQNQERIIRYLENYVDEATLKKVRAFLDTLKKKRDVIDKENVIGIIQYAVAMTWDKECVLNKLEGNLKEVEYMNEGLVRKLILDNSENESMQIRMKMLEELELIEK